MATTDSKTIVHDVPPYLRVYGDGTIERLLGTATTPPADPDPTTGVSSKDVVLFPDTGVSARLYRPSSAASDRLRKLPLVVYFHGGAFCISSPADPLYHAMLNLLVAEARVILVSVDYRLAPESPLPTAHEDSWAALKWVAGHAPGRDGPEPWINDSADFDRVFLAGDSAGANISHHIAMRAGLESPGLGNFKIRGVQMVQPYFWGEKPIGSEAESPVFKSVVDNWWLFVCPSDKGCDDPLINPFADGAPGVSRLACNRVLVCVAGNDTLRERGRLYYQMLVKSGWPGRGEYYESEGEDHVFHLIDPARESSRRLIQRCAQFFNSV